LVFLWGISALAQPWDGLPPTLPAEYVDQPGFLPFEKSADSFPPPIAGSVLVNGQKPTSSIFTEAFWVRIPAGAKIRSSATATGDSVWNYPVGTESLHVISFDSGVPNPFELRMVSHLQAGHWAFGAYRFEGGRWMLNTYSGLQEAAMEVALRRFEGISRVTLKRINLQSCRSCHFMNSRRSQFPTREEAGPCAFVPWNETLATDWMPRFEREFGYRPVEAGAR
jgi:hypothetical protein